MGDLATATALIAYLRALALSQSIELDTALRQPPPLPDTCCGRGCDGCVWESYFTALGHWRDDACGLLQMSALP
ncbi:oxidoreductase-like domain-containing protein [Rhodoferax sp.]|uniref:oxidoreductase-like domain-containing protein n=1 Tax=Rhodoferax sp. TaxID=50421 RepID=UPI0025E2F759|nr:oxidoreductase-like domain-containing protein [Rhodoferax sp.]